MISGSSRNADAVSAHSVAPSVKCRIRRSKSQGSSIIEELGIVFRPVSLETQVRPRKVSIFRCSLLLQVGNKGLRRTFLLFNEANVSEY